MTPKPKTRIFSSENIIPIALRESYPDFSFHDSIEPYDIIAAIDDEVSIVAILDRSKKNTLTISAGEIIDGLRCGLKIYGASEIGALRAKECREFGMIGVGGIYNTLESTFIVQENWLYQTTDSHLSIQQKDASLLLSAIQKDMAEIAALNSDLWQKQQEQFSNSQCSQKWKWIDE